MVSAEEISSFLFKTYFSFLLFCWAIALFCPVATFLAIFINCRARDGNWYNLVFLTNFYLIEFCSDFFFLYSITLC